MEAALQTPTPDHLWNEIGIDLFVSNDEDYLVVVDCYSRYFELKQLTKMTSKRDIEALPQIFPRFGVPDVVCSDNEPQLASAELGCRIKEWEIRHVTSCSNNPAYNGKPWRLVQTTKIILRTEWTYLRYFRLTEPHQG